MGCLVVGRLGSACEVVLYAAIPLRIFHCIYLRCIIDAGSKPELIPCANHLVTSGSVIVIVTGAGVLYCVVGRSLVENNVLNSAANMALLDGVLLLPHNEGKSTM